MKLIKQITTLAVALSALTAISTSAVFAQDKMGDKMSGAPSAMGSKMSDKMGAKDSAIKVTTGKFHNVAHNTKGTATIYENADGSRELRLTGFSTADGPAVHVVLVAAEDVTTDAGVTKAGYLDLGPLKNGKTSQTFKVPAKIDLWKYLAVTIWCDKFDVNFGTAPLTAAKH